MIPNAIREFENQTLQQEWCHYKSWFVSIPAAVILQDQGNFFKCSDVVYYLEWDDKTSARIRCIGTWHNIQWKDYAPIEFNY